MRFPRLAAQALALCALAPLSALDARPNRDRVANQEPPSGIATFRGNEARDAAREQAAKQEIQRLQGTWDCLSWVEGGKVLDKDELKGRTAFFGADVCILRHGGKIMQIVTQKLDPTREPKTVTATVNQGRQKGDVLLGIYELQGDTLRCCFDLEGQKRPTEFSSSAGPNFVLTVYKRRPAHPSEALDLSGRYKSLSLQLDGSEHRADAVIHRRGDSYVISYMKGSAVTYIGVGIRKGDILSVCWANRGQAGISVYRIEEGPNLVGNYTELGGVGYLSREILTFEDAGD